MSDREDVDGSKYGKPLPYDKNFRGPEWRNRGCTDVLCLIIFVIFLVAWGFIANYAIRNGDLSKLAPPSDSFNHKCGLDSSVLNKKYLFFFDLGKCIDPLLPLTGCPTPQVCVERCPSETFVWDTMKNTMSFNEIKQRLICLSDVEKESFRNFADVENAIRNERCARSYIKSEPLLNRCMWEISSRVCEFIPSTRLRNKRTIGGNATVREMLENSGNTPFANIDTETKMQALALTVQPKQNAGIEEPEIQCRRRTDLSVVKEKMRHADTQLSKLVSNIVSYFTNDTLNAQRLGEEIVEDILNSWFIVLVALACTLLAALLLIALMRWLAFPLLWLSIIGVLMGLGAAVYFSFKEYTFRKSTAAATQVNHGLNVSDAVKNIFQDPNTWLWLTILLCVCFVVIFLLVIVLRSRIRIAIALTKEGSKAVSSVISTMFFPIFSWVLYVLALGYAISVYLYLGSIGQPSFRMTRDLDRNSATGFVNENCVCYGAAVNYTLGASCDPLVFQQNCRIGTQSQCIHTSCSYTKIDHPIFVDWSIVYNVFGCLWLLFFISAFSNMVLAATFATWYWTFKKKDVPYFTLSRAFRQTIFYHLGTLAFGSLILAICRMIRIILEYIHNKLKAYDNVVTRAILCCMRCFFWCLESFLRFLNRNAYIMCAIHGKNFCASATDAFNLIMRNFLRVIAIDQVTDFLFFLSKLLLTGASGVCTYYFLKEHPNLVMLHYVAVPTALVAIGAFLISTVFFGVYSTAVDTLFLCFLEDCERNDGSKEKPYYMSKQLMRILGKRNKFKRNERA